MQPSMTSFILLCVLLECHRGWIHQVSTDQMVNTRWSDMVPWRHGMPLVWEERLACNMSGLLGTILSWLGHQQCSRCCCSRKEKAGQIHNGSWPFLHFSCHRDLGVFEPNTMTFIKPLWPQDPPENWWVKYFPYHLQRLSQCRGATLFPLLQRLSVAVQRGNSITPPAATVCGSAEGQLYYPSCSDCQWQCRGATLFLWWDPLVCSIYIL